MTLSVLKSIKTQLFLIAFIVALPAVGIILYSGFQSRRDAINEARKDTLKLADRIITEQQNLVIGAEQLMTALAQLPEVKSHDTARVEPILRKLRALNPMYSNIFIADRNGTVWATAVPTKPPFIVADRRYFRNALASGQLSSGEYVISRATSRPAFNLAYPLKDDHGAVVGVISVGFIIDQYRQLVKRMQLPGNTSLMLIDHHGTILSRVLEPERYIGKPYTPEVFRQMQEGPETATTIRKGIIGDRRIITYYKLRLPGEQAPYMYVAAGIPIDVALHDANRALVENMTLLMSFLGFACALAWLFGKRSITDRISLLQNAAQRLANGDLQLKIAELVAGGELGGLAQSFDHMARQLSLREQALLDSQERLHSFVANAPVVLFGLDKYGLFTFSEGMGLTSLGLNPGQVVGQSVFAVYRDAPSVLEGVRRAMKGVAINTVTTVGDRVFEIWYNPVRNSQGEFSGTIGVATDITERRRAEEEEQKLVSIVEMSRDFIGIATLDGQVTYLNNAALSLVGLDSLAEARTKTIFDFFPEGSLGQAREDLYPTLMTEEYWTGETRFKHFGTGAEIEMEATCFLIKDAQGIPICAATVARDITEHQRLEAQLLQAHKMESIGRLAGGIAHDFNNLLTPIMGYAELLKRSMPPDSHELKRVTSIMAAADKARILTQQLLGFGRKQILEMKIVDMNEVVTSFYEILRRTIRENIDIQLLLSQDTYGIRADRNQLEQIIMNLAINAQDAIKDTGVITIETAPVTMDDEYVHQHAVVTSGNFLMLQVTDSGRGMDPETLAHIFEPFFTTKEVGEGSGLGLATVYGLVKQHGGAIWAYSEIGKGSVFKLYFPMVEEKPVIDEVKASEQSVLDAGCRTILLVEDNDMVRNLVYDLLLNLGFTVLVSEGPQQALKMGEGQHIDLLVTDVVMPDMTGPELHQRLLKTHQGLKVLYMSGYTNDVIVHHGILEKGINFIQKPFAINDLVKKVEVIMHTAATDMNVC